MNLIILAEQHGIAPKKTSNTNGGEYHSPCPECGGRDRFIIHPNKTMRLCTGSYFCRQCGIYGDTINFCRKYFGDSFKEAAQRCNASIDNTFNHIKSRKPIQKGKFTASHAKIPSEIWQKKAAEFVNEANKIIHKHPDVLEYLTTRGITKKIINKYKIGYNPLDKHVNKETWGLDPNENSKSIYLPKGIVIPTIESGNIMRIKIRRTNFTPNDQLPKYMEVSGNMSGFSIIGQSSKTKNEWMIVIESELDAIYLHHLLLGVPVVVAAGSALKNPNIIVDLLAKNARWIFLIHDNDNAGLKMFEKWKQLYKNKVIASPTPIGKDIGEAVTQNFSGIKITDWLLDKLSKLKND